MPHGTYAYLHFFVILDILTATHLVIDSQLWNHFLLRSNMTPATLRTLTSIHRCLYLPQSHPPSAHLLNSAFGRRWRAASATNNQRIAIAPGPVAVVAMALLLGLAFQLTQPYNCPMQPSPLPSPFA